MRVNSPPAILALMALIPAMAFTQYVPPDLYGETYMRSIGFWENMGQVIDTDDQPREDIKFYSEGGFPKAYLRDKSRVSFTVAVVDSNVATVDTLYRLDMRPYGPRANQVAPIGWAQKDWLQNFYMAHCGNNGVEGVIGFNRIIYENIFPNIDQHFYSGSKGQKMAFVMRPGCVLSDLKLAFEGQDSIAIDLWGNLKLYYDGKWMVIPFAQAYQINDLGSIVPVNWEANYQVNNGVGVVGFNWNSYNSSWPLVFQIGIPPFGPTSYDEPGLCWSTYLGGNENDHIYESVEVEGGDLYLVGTTGSSFMTFPQAPGTNYSAAGTAAYMMRFNTDDDIEWKTFLGGQAAGELTRGTAIGRKVEGQVYIAGNTSSASMIHLQPGTEFYQTAANAGVYKGFVARLNKGNGERQWSTYYGDDNTYIYGMVGLGPNKIFIVGSTISTIPALDVPPPIGSTYWPYSNDNDGFISMFGNGDRHMWRCHIPGNASDVAYDVDTKGASIVVGGVTESTDINLIPFESASYSTGPFGEIDCFLYEFSTDGAVLWSTYVGTEVSDWSLHNGVAVDPTTNDIVLVGVCGGGSNVGLVPGTGWYQHTNSTNTYPGFIARFSGIDRSRIWHTHIYDAIGTTNYLICCEFDSNGKLIVGGWVKQGDDLLPAGPSLLSQSLPGLYQQSQIYVNQIPGTVWISHQDAILLIFSPTNELLYGTYFGGEASAAGPINREIIYTILPRSDNGNLYFGGITSKGDNPASYFPLDDGGGGPYFEEIWQGGSTEGFIASLCGEPLNEVGISEGGITVAQLFAHWSQEQVTIFDLPNGQYGLQVVDAAGRLVVSDIGRSDGTRLNLNLPNLAEGTYLLRVGTYATRFVVIR